MITLDKLKNTNKRKPRKRVGRGLGSKLGKTCGRGEKGAGSRSGYRRRYGKEGGNMPLYMKLPIRGFNNAQFRREYDAINLDQLDQMFEDGDTVNMETLKAKGFISGKQGVKLLGKGKLTKKLHHIHVQGMSNTARDEITRLKISFEIGKQKKGRKGHKRHKVTLMSFMSFRECLQPTHDLDSSSFPLDALLCC